jgi:predicted dehydrogenase
MANMLGDQLRVGIVGAGIGAGYVAGFQKQPGVEVTAICARTPTRIAGVALRYGIPRRYTVYEQMLAQERLDIVAIATPNYLHHPMVLAALDAGKHVLCDKPLAMNVTQAREMVAKAESSGLRHFVPFTWRFLAAALYVKEIIASGFLGELYHANVRYYVSGWGDPQGPMRWQYDKERAGTGALGNLGSHAIHLIEWWLGPIQRVCARLRTAVKQRLTEGKERVAIHVDDTCAVLAELADGAPVVFDISSVALVPRVSIEISLHGGEGSLVFQDDWGSTDASTGRIFAMRRNDQVPSSVPIPIRLTGEFLQGPDFVTPVRSCFARMAAEFIGAIRENRVAEPNFHDGLRVQEVIEGILKSAAEERWVAV